MQKGKRSVSKAVFIPNQNCTHASGACFTEGHCLGDCKPASLKRKVGLTDWEQGVLMAASVLISLHDLCVPAADIVSQLGLATADCSSLDEFDRENLKKIQGDLGGAIKLRGL